MKISTTLKIALAAFAVNVVLFACTSSVTDTPTLEKPMAEEAGYEKEADIPAAEVTCHTGGPGKSTCKIEPGIKIGEFVTVGCSVSCEEGYYACCGIRCVCKPNVE